MSKADVSAGRAFVSLFMKDNLTKPLKNAQKQLHEFGSSLLGIGTKVAGLGAAIGGGLAAAVMQFAKVGSDLNDLSARTGISTTALVELGFAADMTGADMETLEGGIRKMQKNLGGIGPESAKAIESLSAMGLELGDISGLEPEEQFQRIAESIGEIEDPSKRAAAAMAIFGGSGVKLLPMLEDIRALREEARELDITPSPESIAAADLLGDTIDKVRKVVGAAFVEIGAAVAPMAQSLLEGFLFAARAVKKFVGDNRDLIRSIGTAALGLMAAGAAIAAIGGGFIFAGMAITGFLTVFSAVSATAAVVSAVVGALLSPLALIVAALAAGGYAWMRFTANGREFASFVSSTFGKISTTVTDTFGGITDAIMGGDLELAGKIAMTGLRLVFAQGLEAIHAMLGETLGGMIGQLLSGDFSGAFATLGSTLLDTWAKITAGYVKLWTAGADAVMAKWQKTVNAISDLIIDASSQGGMMGWAMEQISGVDMKAEKERGDKIKAEQLAKGLATDQGSGLVKSDEFQHAGLAALKESVRAAGQSVNDYAKGITDATGQAVEDKVGGSSAAASARAAQLKAELAALRKSAADKVQEFKAGANKRGPRGDAEGEGEGGGGDGGFTPIGERQLGKASAATFSLASLSATAANGQLQATLGTKKAVEMQTKQQKELHDEQLAEQRSRRLHHA